MLRFQTLIFSEDDVIKAVPQFPSSTWPSVSTAFVCVTVVVLLGTTTLPLVPLDGASTQTAGDAADRLVVTPERSEQCSIGKIAETVDCAEVGPSKQLRER